MQPFFSYLVELERRNIRTESDLVVLESLQSRIKVFQQLINSNPSDPAEEGPYKNAIFSALKNIGQAVAALSKRQGDLRDGKPQIPWAELSAMVVHFYQFRVNHGFDRLDQQQIIAFASELSDLADLIPSFVVELTAHASKQKRLIAEFELASTLFSHYQAISAELSSIYIELNCIPYNLKAAEFAETYAANIQARYQLICEHLAKIRELQLPPHLEILAWQQNEQDKIDQFIAKMQAVFVEYNAQNRNQLINVTRELNELIIDTVLKREINQNDPAFANYKFLPVLGKRSVQTTMPQIQSFMRELTARQSIFLIIKAIEQLLQSSLQGQQHFRAAELDVLIMLGENCRFFPQDIKQYLPEEVWECFTNLRNTIIHCIDEVKGRTALATFLMNDINHFDRMVFEELVKLRPLFQAIVKGEAPASVPILNTGILTALITQFTSFASQADPGMKYPERALLRVVSLFDNRLFSQTDPCLVAARNFYLIYCGEIVRPLEANNLLFYQVASREMQSFFEELVNRRGELVHELTARGVDGAEKSWQLCMALQQHQAQFEFLCNTMNAQGALFEHVNACVNLETAYVDLVFRIVKDSEFLGSSQLKRRNRANGTINAAVEHEAQVLRELATNDRIDLSFVGDIWENVFKAGTESYNSDFSPSKLLPTQTRELLARDKQSPQKMIASQAEQTYRNLRTKYENLCKTLEKLAESLQVHQTASSYQLIDQCEKLKTELEVTLGNLENIRAFRPLIDAQYCTEGKGLRTEPAKANTRKACADSHEAKRVRKALFGDDSTDATLVSNFGIFNVAADVLVVDPALPDGHADIAAASVVVGAFM